MRFVVNFNTLIIKTSPKGSAQYFPKNSCGESGCKGNMDGKDPDLHSRGRREESRGRVTIHMLLSKAFREPAPGKQWTT